MNQKIGIVTFHNSNNYGAILQVYALQQTCLGINKTAEVSIVNYSNENIKTPSPFKEIVMDIKNAKIKSAIKHILGIMLNQKKYSKLNKFRKQRLNITYPEFNDENKFNKYVSKFDILITGSDQVWNTKIFKGYNQVYFLETEDNHNLKKISYAASVGDCEYSDEEKIRIQEQLRSYFAISIREEKDKQKIEDLSQKKVFVTLDPTLLLEKKDWENIFQKKRLLKEKYILVYTVENNETIVKIVNYLSNLTGYKVVYFTKLANYNNKYCSVFSSGIEEFLNFFYNAEYIVTNSFHGTVFSIIFEKQFWVVNHSSRGSRIDNLLSICNLEKRLYNDRTNLEDLSNKKINYNYVIEKLNIERKKSIEYLKKSMNKE